MASAQVGMASPESGASDARFTCEQLESDLERLYDAIRNEHPLIYADRSELERVAQTARAELRDGMTDLEFLRVASSLVRAANCGHARLELSEEAKKRFEEEAHFLPLTLRVVAGKLVVERSVETATLPAGAIIRRIDGRDAEEILKLLCERMPGDGSNVTRKLFQLNERFHAWYALLVSVSSEHAVDYFDPQANQEKSTRLKGVTKAAWPDGEDEDKEPREIGDYTFADDHAWLRLKSFFFYTDAENRRFRAFVDEFFAALAKRGATTLVLDLRGNGGGDPYCGAYLLSHLIERPIVYFAESGGYYPDLRSGIAPAKHAFAGKLFVLVDGGVFSTAGHVASLLKFHGRGRFVGEETGGSSACTSNSHEIALGHTGLRLSNARTVFRTAVSDLPAGRGVMPDEEVMPGLGDLLTGRDPVRERVLALVRGDAD